MSIHKLIREGRARLGLTEHEFAKLVGVSRGAVQQWEREGGTAPRRANQKQVADALGISLAQLMSGESDNVTEGPEVRNRREYPLVSWVQAGEWSEISDQFQPGDAEGWKGCHKNLGAAGYVLRVTGDSMTAGPGAAYTFPEGILIYVNPDMDPTAGQFVVVRREGEKSATFKKLVQVDGELFLEAINPTWPNRYLKLREGDHFCGVVMHAGFDMP